MGHQDLQRVFVRMLYDASFVEAARADPDGVLVPAGLTTEERAQILEADARAFRTDPLRRQRTLRMLNDEFKISTTLALAETRSLAFALAFFSSAEFHEAVQARRAIVSAYGDYLEAATRDGRLRTPQLPDVVRFEAAMARCRRDARMKQPSRARDARLRRAPGIRVGVFAAHVIETIHRVEHYLFELGLMPAVALCDDAPRVGELPPLSDERVYLLFATEGADVAMSYIDAPMFAVLDAMGGAGTTREHMHALLVEQGIAKAAATAAIQGLLREGILVE